MKPGLALVVAAACGRIAFDATSNVTSDAPIGDGRARDGTGVTFEDGPGVGCSSDAFASAPPCTGWGTVIATAATVSQANGLTIAPNANDATAIGGCLHAATAFGAGGVFADVGQLLTQGDTAIAITGAGVTFTMSAANGTVVGMSEPGQVSVPLFLYDASADRYWRMRPSGGFVAYETSPDASTWTLHYTSTNAAPATVSIELDAQTPAAEPAPGTAIFRAITACP